jgi:DNA-binding NarL/FixJ family response regulator
VTGTVESTSVDKAIRVALLDEHDLLRVSLARLLASQPGLEIVAECGTPAEALAALGTSPVEIVLLDFDRDAGRADHFLTASREAGYSGSILIIASDGQVRAAAAALKLGASGIFLKSGAPDRLVHAIKVVANGEIWVDPKVVQLLADQLSDQQPHTHETTLPDREHQVLLGILAGLTNRKIGENMGLSESSVKNIVQRLFSKAGVKTRTQLVRVALEGSLGDGSQASAVQRFASR